MYSHNITKNPEFIKTFGNTATNNHTIEPRQSETCALSRAGNLNPINTDEASFFDFEPTSRTDSPYHNNLSTPGCPTMVWSNEATFGSFTPPSSASFSSKSWPYNSYQQTNPPNIFTNLLPPRTRVHYGQVTPPDDEIDNESVLDFSLAEQPEEQDIQPPQDTGKRKVKRSSANGDSTNHSSLKRTRKYPSRRSNNTNEFTKPEDVRRSKFLERNRVAASKCRQKKKEWTQNLENRARQLQKDNNQLRMVVESCRDEILFLKGELLKHSQCECESIQTFIKSGDNDFSDHKVEKDLFKRETSPIEDMPSSRLGSLDASSGRNDHSSLSPVTESRNASIADDDNALEALLTCSINHATSNEGIKSPALVAAAG